MPTAIEPDAQHYELVAVGALRPHPENPRKGDVEAIATSIVKNGWHGALVVQRSTGFVLVGNHRLMAAKQVGMTQVPVLWRDVDDDTAVQILVGDNRASDFGYFDEADLLPLLKGADADALAGMLFTSADLALMAHDAPAVEVEPDPGDDGVDPNRAGLNKASPGASQDDYLATQTRTISLPFGLETYLTVTDGLRRLRQARDVQTTADLVAILVAEAVAELDAEA